MAVVVLGAGIVGLSTACTLRERLDSRIDVTVIGEKFDTETTSFGAAGISLVRTAGENNPERYRRWASESLRYNYKLARSADAPKAGVLALPIYEVFYEENPPARFYKDYMMDVTEVSRSTLAKLGVLEEYKSAHRLTTTLVESRYYLPFLRDKFESMGGQVERRRVNSLSELAPDFDIAVNCTGLGARELCNDSEMIPVRGQLLRVRAPSLKTGWMCDRTGTHIFPGREYVALGGSYQVGVENYSNSEADTLNIMTKTRRLEPRLERAVIEEVWTGVRPIRKQVRLEIDPTSFDLPVVHNYGHGSYGIALSYGCSIEAAEKIERLLRRFKPKL